MTLIARLTRADITPVVERTDPALVVKGDPVQTTWNLEERDGLFCGMWQCTPGAWKVRYDEWEYVYIHEGHSVLTDSAGVQTVLRAGDSYVIRPGYEGVWEVIETTLKDYVIR